VRERERERERARERESMDTHAPAETPTPAVTKAPWDVSPADTGAVTASLVNTFVEQKLTEDEKMHHNRFARRTVLDTLARDRPEGDILSRTKPTSPKKNRVYLLTAFYNALGDTEALLAVAKVSAGDEMGMPPAGPMEPSDRKIWVLKLTRAVEDLKQLLHSSEDDVGVQWLLEKIKRSRMLAHASVVSCFLHAIWCAARSRT
jgi:hypothetical protein